MLGSYKLCLDGKIMGITQAYPKAFYINKGILFLLLQHHYQM
jgi:hypothetical protein